MLPPLPISALFYGYLKLLKATRKGKSQKKNLGSHLGIKLGTSRTEGPALLNRLSANPSSMLYSLQKSRTSCFVIFIITIAVAKSKHFSYHVVFLDVSAHGNVQLVGNCSSYTVLNVTSWTCIVDCQCVRLQKNWYKVFI